MRRWMMLIALVTMLAFLPRTCWADEPQFQYKLKPIPPGPDVRHVLKAGQPAPIDGILFSPETALRWGNYIEQALDRWQLDVETTKKIYTIEMKAQQERADLEKRVLTEGLKNEQAARIAAEQKLLAPRPFYASPWFGAAVGVGVTALGALLIVSVAGR